MATTRKPRNPDLDGVPLGAIEIEQLPQVTQRVERREATAPLDDVPLDEDAGSRRARWPQIYEEYHAYMPSWLTIGVFVAAIGASAALGMWTQPHVERQTSMAQIAQSIATSVPAVRAQEVSNDPGKYTGKVIDMVMAVNRGGVYKSGKGLYLQEYEGGVSLVIFQSAFQAFVGESGRAEDIPAKYIGKYVKARGIVQKFNDRLSMIVSAPGLLSEIPLP